VQVLADRGYFKIEEIKATVEQDITPYAPKWLTSSNRKHGKFEPGNYIYIEADDEYKCPANTRLPKRSKTTNAEKVVYWYCRQ
jgi:hypothetical protein